MPVPLSPPRVKNDLTINFLAHLTLSHFDPDLQTGNFLGDFVKGAAVKRLPATIQRGITMHREIDHLTDTEPTVRALNNLLYTRHGRYASVVTDIGFDYYLYQHWETFGPAPFAEFTESAYTNLFARRAVMPAQVQGYVTQMVKDEWLRLYTTHEGMLKVFGRLAPRLSHPELLEGVDQMLVDFDDAFNQTFLVLFPRLQTLANAYRTEPTAPH